MDRSELKKAMEAYKFYHVIQITDEISTPGWEHLVSLQQPIHRFLNEINLQGKRFLDIGCRDGLFSFLAEKAGAKEVIGIDNDVSPAATEFLIPYFNSHVKMYELNLLDLTPQTFGLFDVVLFAGVLYHLRYPFWALKLVRDVTIEDGLVLIETGILVDNNQRSLLFCPTGNESPYEPTSCSFFNIKGLIDTLFSLGLVVEKIELLSVQNTLKLNPPAPQMIQIELTDETIETLAPPYVTFEPSFDAELVDRAMLLCRKSSSVTHSDLIRYWDGTHKIHDINKIFSKN